MRREIHVFMDTSASNMRALRPDLPPIEIKGPIAVAPDVVGTRGRAWKCDLLRVRNANPETDATLVHWLIEAPWAHPCWHSYSLVMIHLRPLAGEVAGGETKFYLPCATHELWLYALDPNKERESMIKTGAVDNRWLRPANFGAQFTELNDEDALARILTVVTEVCNGELSPDTDHTRAWIKRFGHSMIKKEFR